MNHVHVGALSWLVDFLELVIGLYVLRYFAARFPDHALGRAAAALN